jgi:two-component system chemotaxis response regulator CheY
MLLSSASKIIIADDLIPMLVSLRRVLNQLGLSEIYEAVSGEEALTALDEHPDTALVISDWNMQPIDGLELLEAIRKDARFKTLPFILVSAETSPRLREQAMNAGASAVLAKPFDPETLRKTIVTIGAA